MQKFALLFLAIVTTAMMVLSLSGGRKSGISGGGSTTVASPSVSLSSTQEGTGTPILLPTGEDTIRTFIRLIDEHKISEALSMMDTNLITNESVKQQYGSIFDSFYTAYIEKIMMEDFGKEEWTEGEERYRADIRITLKPQQQKGLWDEGINTRWITVVKQANGRFLIHDIATGP